MADTHSKTILVTGAMGNLGRATMEALGRHGFKVKAATRNPMQAVAPAGVEIVKLDYTEPDTVEAALQGLDGLFLIAPPLDPEAPAKLKPVIDKAKAASVDQIVFISALGVDQNEEAPLRVLERYLQAAAVNHTILRPNFFMQNFSSGFIAPMIMQGSIFLAADKGLTSFISTSDIAEVAAHAFQNGSQSQEYNLTGPGALDHDEAARIISEVAGREIKYCAIAEEAMLQGARDGGMPEGAVQYLAALYSVVRNGSMDTVTEDVRKATGKPPISFEQFARMNASVWQQ